MRRITYICLLSCSVLAGCEKPPLVVYPGDPAQSAGTVPNSAPIVTAGDDVTLQWPTDFVQLTGSATDDGVRSPLKYTWTAQPAGVQFDSSISAQTTARFAQPGTYTLTLMVDDGALQTSDSLVVTVKEVASNLAPVVSAGADVTIDFPRPAKLDGTATDDGVPTTTLTATWSRLNGPGDVTFVNASSIDTAAKFSALGTYELQLSVTDGELTATDVVIVTVGPAVYPAADLSEDDPNRGWSRIAPADVGLDPAPLAEAQAYALTAGGSGVISRYGRIVHSWGDIDQRFDVKSTTKSIAGTALAFALEDGLVRMNDLAATHVPEIQTQPAENAGDGAGSITLLQLATHTAGFEKIGDFGRIVNPPGTAWRYSDGGLNWLADALTTVNAQDLQKLFNARLYPVLGVAQGSATSGDDIRWRNTQYRKVSRPLSPVQYREFASGMLVNTHTMARVGLLYLRRGEWSGAQRVFAPEFVDLVTTPRPENIDKPSVDQVNFPDAHLRYGVLWWTNATGALPNVPRDAYWAWGLYDSLIVVIPSLDLVIARAGTATPPDTTRRNWGEEGWNSDYAVLAPFLDPIVRAVQE